jgi:hypothetical protein
MESATNSGQLMSWFRFRNPARPGLRVAPCQVSTDKQGLSRTLKAGQTPRPGARHPKPPTRWPSIRLAPGSRRGRWASLRDPLGGTGSKDLSRQKQPRGRRRFGGKARRCNFQVLASSLLSTERCDSTRYRAEGNDWTSLNSGERANRLQTNEVASARGASQTRRKGAAWALRSLR